MRACLNVMKVSLVIFFIYFSVVQFPAENTDPLAQLLGITAPPDKTKVVSYTIVASFAVFALWYLVSYASSTFRSLKTKEKVFWCLSVVRALFGVFAIFVSCWHIFVDTTLYNDVVETSTFSSHYAMCITVGFFFFECTTLFSSNIIFREFDGFLATHHLLSLVGFGAVLYNGKTHFFAITILLNEMTTPFSCLCWVLLKAKMADTYAWKANQIVLVHLFHCRTLLEGYLYLMTYRHWNNIITNMPWSNFLLLYVGLTLAFFVLTPYWTYKKTKQLFKPEDWNHPEKQKGEKHAKEN